MSPPPHVRPCPGCGCRLTLNSFQSDLPPLFRLCDRCSTRSPAQRTKPRSRRFIVYIALILLALVAAHLYL